jgi:ABC-type amino acid transport substrate-binding protein
MISAIMRRAAMAGALATAAAVLLTAPAASAATTPGWAHRTLAVESLSHFRVVLTATRDGGSPPRATVTATGFRWSGGLWRRISTQVIGRPGQWFWFSVDTCSLTASQYQGAAPTRRVATIRVSLLATPSIGCSRSYFRSWRP